MIQYTRRKQSGLVIPEKADPDRVPSPKELPRFSMRMFECYYESDAKRFEELVKQKGGYFCGHIETGFLNFQNMHVGRLHVIVYQFHEEIEMEVLC